MKKVNFNSLENSEVPEEWIEKAINAKPKKKPLLLRPYVWGTAASVVLVAAASLFILKPFKNSDSLPAAVGTTAAPTEAAKTDDAPASTTGTEPAAKPETTAPTEATKSTDAPASTTETVPLTVQTDPADDTTYIPEGRSVYHIDSEWEVDLSSARPDSRSTSGEIPKEPMLTKDELFTGNITVEVLSDSRFYSCDTIYMDFSGYYNNGSRKIDGRVILAPKQTEDGKISATFNLFYDEAYTPSADYTIRIYTLNDNGSKTDVETLTKPLYSDNSITISI